MARVLVTGGAGFIGSHLVSALVERGDEVVVLDDLSTGFRRNLSGTNAEVIEGDIRDRGLVEEVISGCELVFHHAAMISVPRSMKDPFSCYDINLIGSLNVLWAAHRVGVRRVVLASSSAVYGEVKGPVKENGAKQPQSPYACSKLAMEEAAQMFSREYGLETVCLRYFNVYGPRQSPDSPYAAAIPLFIQAMIDGQSPVIYGDGCQTRSFIHVEDVARANMLAAEKPDAAGGIFNIAGNGSISINQLIETITKLIPGTPEPVFDDPRPGDIRFSDADTHKVHQALGYRPEIVLEEGLKNTIEWYKVEKGI